MRRVPFLASCLVFLCACGDTTSPEVQPVALRVTAPAQVPAGQPFSLTVEAVGSDGGGPIASVNGPVDLSVSTGSITPSTARLVDGTATLDVSLSVAEGPVTISATAGTLTGSASVRMEAPRILPGDPARPAVEAIPDIFFVPDPDDYTIPHPGIPDIAVSHDVLLLALDPTATTGDVNDLLTGLDAVIVGGIPGLGGSYSGLLVLRLPFDGHDSMDSLRAELDGSPLVRAAAPDHLDDEDRVPSSVGNDALWQWDPIPLLGNWGFEFCRVPQMWNLHDGLERRGWNPVPLGEIDTGVAAHGDLTVVGDLTPGQIGDHGTHVAGIMVATQGGGGVDGVTRYGALIAAGLPRNRLSDAAIHFWIADLAKRGVRVVNISVGKKWKHDPSSDLGAIALMESSAKVFRSFHEGQLVDGEPILLVATAGNGSSTFEVPARFNSSRAYAALELGWPHVFVVEATTWNLVAPSRAGFSNPGGHVSAPGVDIMSTLPGNGYGLRSGTSMAAPFVTGLIANLWAVDDGLSHAQLLDLLQDTATPVQPTAGLDGAPMVDAFAATMEIDRLRGNDDVLRLLLDIDDGTPDGNLRVDPVTGQPFFGTDADGNGGVGDGNVDMADFRRWRDLFLEARNKETPLELDLDGPADHPKRDVNGDGKVTGEVEPFPLADFNGDGKLDPEAERPFGGRIQASVTDLDVLAREFFDFVHEKEDLPKLVYSGDLTVDASALLAGAGTDEVWSRVDNELGPVEAVLHSNTGAIAVYTLAVDDGPYTVTAYRRSAGGDSTCVSRDSLDVTLGGDLFWQPECTGVEIGITLAEFVEPGVPSPLLVRAGVRKEDGSVEYRAGLRISLAASGGTVEVASGVTDAEGFLGTTATLAEGQTELVVTVIADDPDTGAGAVATATARKLPGGAEVTFLRNGNGLIVVATAQLQFTEVCRDQYEYDPGEEVTDLLPFDESFQATCSLSDPDCGSSSADFGGALKLEIVREAVGGRVLSIRMNGSIEGAIDRSFECGGFGPQGSQARAVISFNFVLPEQTAVRLVGSADPAAGGAVAGLRIDTGFTEASWFEAAAELDEAGLLGSGEHRFDVFLEARPEYGVPSAGTFSLELFFGD